MRTPKRCLEYDPTRNFHYQIDNIIMPVTAFSTANDLKSTRQNHSSIHIYVFPILVPPQWAADPPPKNITLVIEKNGTLECQVTASPSADVSWYKNGKLLQSSEYVHFDFLYVNLHNIEK